MKVHRIGTAALLSAAATLAWLPSGLGQEAAAPAVAPAAVDDETKGQFDEKAAEVERWIGEARDRLAETRDRDDLADYPDAVRARHAAVVAAGEANLRSMEQWLAALRAYDVARAEALEAAHDEADAGQEFAGFEFDTARHAEDMRREAGSLAQNPAVAEQIAAYERAAAALLRARRESRRLEVERERLQREVETIAEDFGHHLWLVRKELRKRAAPPPPAP